MSWQMLKLRNIFTAFGIFAFIVWFYSESTFRASKLEIASGSL